MRPRAFTTSLRRIPIALVLSMVASACGLTTTQRAAVRDFSHATAALGEVTAGEFVQMRDTTIRMNTARAELARPGEAAGALEGAFSVEAVMARTRAAITLREYGELLQALVDDTQGPELQSAVDRFVVSVRGLPSAERRLDDAKLAALGRLVQSAGGLLIEAKKKAAIQRLVPEADPQVAFLCDKLAADFDPDGTRLASQFLLAANLLRTDAGTAMRRASAPESRAAAIDAYELAVTSGARRDAVHARAAEAAKQLKAANRALRDAVASNEISREDLESYATTVQTLVDAMKVLH